MNTQTELFNPAAESKISDTERDAFRYRLIMAGTWQTRADLCSALNWPDRKVRACAESLGAEVVRCQRGFKLMNQITTDEERLVREAIHTFRSQAGKMEEYANSLTYALSTRTPPS